MRAEEIRALGSTELSKQLEEAQQELFNLRFRHATKQLVNYRELNKVKKKIARMKTILREKELAHPPEKGGFPGGAEFAGEIGQ